MIEGTAGRKLGRVTASRTALFSSLATALFRYEQITTTEHKAKELRRFAERIITRARKAGLVGRRETARYIRDKEVAKKIFDSILPRYRNNTGGYVAVIKLGCRQGDRARMAVVRLVQPAASDNKLEGVKDV